MWVRIEWRRRKARRITSLRSSSWAMTTAAARGTHPQDPTGRGGQCRQVDALTGEKADLAQELAGAVGGEDGLVGTAVVVDDLGLAVEEDDEVVGVVTLGEEDLPGGDVGLAAVAPQHVDLGRIEERRPPGLEVGDSAIRDVRHQRGGYRQRCRSAPVPVHRPCWGYETEAERGHPRSGVTSSGPGPSTRRSDGGARAAPTARPCSSRPATWSWPCGTGPCWRPTPPWRTTVDGVASPWPTTWASPDEVDAITEAARRAGATVAREPADTFWGGYDSIVIDPDGHPWEIAHNPGWGLTEDGAVRLG
jgi:hypothetical protein